MRWLKWTFFPWCYINSPLFLTMMLALAGYFLWMVPTRIHVLRLIEELEQWEVHGGLRCHKNVGDRFWIAAYLAHVRDCRHMAHSVLS